MILRATRPSPEGRQIRSSGPCKNALPKRLWRLLQIIGVVDGEPPALLAEQETARSTALAPGAWNGVAAPEERALDGIARHFAHDPFSPRSSFILNRTITYYFSISHPRIFTGHGPSIAASTPGESAAAARAIPAGGGGTFALKVT
jgi:hypothetical protein